MWPGRDAWAHNALKMRLRGVAAVLVVVLLSGMGGGVRAGSDSSSASTSTEVAENGPTAAGNGVAAGQPFELAVGGSATVAETQTTLMFRGVQEDSRCPA